VGGDAAGVEVDPSGALVLGSTRTETYFAWIANYLFATVTRLDTRDGSQVAEYDSVLLDGRNHAAPPGQECEVERRGGNCPSRTAVDLRGAVYVANRAFFGQGTVTKIAGLESDCIDRNGDGAIQTSRDVDGDGVIERTIPGEFWGQMDECLLWTVDVGGADGIPRAIAVDASGTIWVGLNGERRAVQLDPTDGRVLRTVDLPSTSVGGGFRPYGAAADGAGNVWFVEAATGTIVSVDAATGRPEMMDTAFSRAGSCSGSYGMAIDSQDRVWLAGFLCPYVFRYDPTTRTWRDFSLPMSGVTRGIAADASDRIYVATSHDWLRFRPDGTIDASPPVSRLTTFDGNTGGSMRLFSSLPGRGTTGVGLDSAGQVWLVNQDSSTATRVDPTTGIARDFPTGISPYTYSDFTGYALRTFTAPNGYIRTVIAGCAVGPTEWETVSWNATVPAGTRVELRARTADRVVDLATATWVGPFASRPTDLMSPPGPIGTGRHVEIEIQLYSDGAATSPSIDDVTIQYNCP
jgi:streptogramin lyase